MKNPPKSQLMFDYFSANKLRQECLREEAFTSYFVYEGVRYDIDEFESQVIDVLYPLAVIGEQFVSNKRRSKKEL